MKQNKYIISKPLMYVAFIIMLGLIMYGILTEGFRIFEPVETFNCTPPNIECQFRLRNGSILTLNYGESKIINDFDRFKLKVINWGSISVLIAILMINHIIYNKNYSFISKYKEIIKNFKL